MYDIRQPFGSNWWVTMELSMVRSRPIPRAAVNSESTDIDQRLRGGLVGAEAQPGLGSSDTERDVIAADEACSVSFLATCPESAPRPFFALHSVPFCVRLLVEELLKFGREGCGILSELEVSYSRDDSEPPSAEDVACAFINAVLARPRRED